MERVNKILWGVMLLTFITACKKQEVNLVYLKTYEISITNKIDYNLYALQSNIIDNQELLTFTNRKDTIYTIDYESNKLNSQYVNLVPTAYVYNKDKLYIYEEINKLLKVFEKTKNIENQVSFNKYTYLDYSYDFRGSLNNEMLFSNNHLILSAALETDKPLDFVNACNLGNYNLITHNLTIGGNNMNSGVDNGFYYSYLTLNHGKVVVSCENLDKVDLYSADNLKFIETHNLYKSKYLNNVNGLNLDSIHKMSYLMRFYMENGKYLGLTYDKYRNLYYRVIIHNIDKKQEFYSSADFYIKNWSIQIYDDNFNLLNEIKFDAKKYLAYNFVIVKKGLLVSKMTPTFLENYNEPKIMFDLFEIKIK